MKKKLGRVYYFFKFCYYQLKGNHYLAQANRWFAAGGDASYLLNYPLNDTSLVVDVGGYTGVFTQQLVDRFNSRVFVFEPVNSYVEILKNKFKDNKKINILPIGLSDKNTSVEIFLNQDGTSLYRSSSEKAVIQVRKASDIFSELAIDSIDLLSINIEGAEYPVLEDLILSGWMNKIKNIQIQFHDFVDDAESKRRKIIESLLKTHKATFSYPFVWEGFVSKSTN